MKRLTIFVLVTVALGVGWLLIQRPELGWNPRTSTKPTVARPAENQVLITGAPKTLSTTEKKLDRAFLGVLDRSPRILEQIAELRSALNSTDRGVWQRATDHTWSLIIDASRNEFENENSEIQTWLRMLFHDFYQQRAEFVQKQRSQHPNSITVLYLEKIARGS